MADICPLNLFTYALLWIGLWRKHFYPIVFYFRGHSRTYFEIQWGGWFFIYNTLPFGWKISPYVHHSTGLMTSNFLRSLGIPCFLYIDDRHNGQLQVPLDKGEYGILNQMKTVTLQQLSRRCCLWHFTWYAWGTSWVCQSQS